VLVVICVVYFLGFGEYSFVLVSCFVFVLVWYLSCRGVSISIIKLIFSKHREHSRSIFGVQECRPMFLS
jgi:hypothetical protein